MFHSWSADGEAARNCFDCVASGPLCDDAAPRLRIPRIHWSGCWWTRGT